MQLRPEQILNDHQLRRTAVRLAVLRIFLEADEALSQSYLEQQFEQVDRITLYRTLRTFEQKGVIHRALDGTDTPKYALCAGECNEHAHHDQHAHFHCDDCGRTYCLEEMVAPRFHAPRGFRVDEAHMVLTGVCKECLEGVSP